MEFINFLINGILDDAGKSLELHFWCDDMRFLSQLPRNKYFIKGKVLFHVTGTTFSLILFQIWRVQGSHDCFWVGSSRAPSHFHLVTVNLMSLKDLETALPSYWWKPTVDRFEYALITHLTIYHSVTTNKKQQKMYSFL